MKKKITAFILAFTLFTFTTFIPAFATVTPEVIDFPLLNDAFATLYFMCGLDYNFTAESEQGLYELMDDKTRELWANDQAAKKERLDNALDDFIDSVKRGYGIAFNLDNELYEYMQEAAYADVIAPNAVYKDAPQQMKNWVAGQTGNLILVSNAQGGLAPDKKRYQFFNVGSYQPLENPVLLSSGAYANSPTGYEYQWQLTQNAGYNIRYTYCNMGNNEDSFGTAVIDYSNYALVWTNYNPIEYAYILNHTSSYAFSTNSLINDYITSGQYTGIIDGVYGTDTDGNVIIDSTGDFPNVIGRETIGGYTDSITDGETTWGAVIGSFATSTPAEPSIPAPDGSLTIDQLDSLIADLHLERLQTKFPFCIPHDLQLIFTGATAVSSNTAPVITIPMHLEFNNVVYYDDPECVTIDFNDFLPVVIVFREGFFLLFLLGMIWLSIQIMQAFFVVTE